MCCLKAHRFYNDFAVEDKVVKVKIESPLRSILGPKQQSVS